MNHKTQTEQEFQKQAVQIKERMIGNLNRNEDYYLELAKKTDSLRNYVPWRFC